MRVLQLDQQVDGKHNEYYKNNLHLKPIILRYYLVLCEKKFI
jgi:hypothetical protein